MLNTYITQVQRLLHDTKGQLWTTSELTDYINEARGRVAQDTKCLRQLITGLNLVTGQELYTVATFIPPQYAPYVVDIMGIHVYWGQTRWPLSFMSFSNLNTRLRSWTNLLQRPLAYARMGTLQVYLAPIPDQAYVTDWDIALAPQALVTDSTPEQIPIPFQEPVQYYAAFKAKFREQALGEAEMFKQQYKTNLRECAVGYMGRIIATPWLG